MIEVSASDWIRVGNSISFACSGCDGRQCLYVGLFNADGETRERHSCKARECPRNDRIRLLGFDADKQDRKAG